MTHAMTHANSMPTGMAFLAGIGAGALVAILFAPRSGQETRHQLKEAALNARRKAQQTMEEQANKVDVTVGNALDSAQHLAEEGKTKVDNVADKARKGNALHP